MHISKMRAKNSKFLLLPALALLGLTVVPAAAQDEMAQDDAPMAMEDTAGDDAPAPAQDNLAPARAPAPSAPPQTQTVTERTVTENTGSPAATGASTTATSPVLQSGPVDPCPIPAADMAKTPDDLAKVQADIDRYTLCMERAQLLQRLNDLAMENQEKLNAASGVSTENPGMTLDQLPSFDAQKEKVMSSIGDVGTVSEQAVATPPDSNEWLILKIKGTGANLSAQLGKSDGTLLQVKPGDTLPDGATVNSVSATSVDITQDGESKSLRWPDERDLAQPAK